jgi:protein ImuB
VVARTTGQKRLVYAVSQEAAEHGLCANTAVALAQASLAGLTVVGADLSADARALERLALWALRYTPLVQADEPDGLALDIGGAAHLFGGEEALLRDLRERFSKKSFLIRTAVSSSRLLSWALTRFGGGTRIVPPGGEAAAAGGLPVAALGMERGVTDALHRLGFDRIEQLFAAPRAGLARRFGRELLLQLDRIVGREAETLEPISAPQLTCARLIFAEPIAHSAGIEGALGRLADDLCRALYQRGEGARMLDLRCYRIDGEVSALRVRTAAPSREAKHLCRLFAENLDRIDPGFGIERMVLAAPAAEPITARQLGAEEKNEDIAGFVDQAAARNGPRSIFRMEPTEQDLPERSFRTVPPLSAPSAIGWDRRPRPVQLIAPPQRIDVLALLPDHPPARFTWRGQQRRVVRADGPECIFGEWWQADEEIALTRDYYRVEDEAGGRWWLFRARDTASGRTEWFVHGVFG